MQMFHMHFKIYAAGTYNTLRCVRVHGLCKSGVCMCYMFAAFSYRRVQVRPASVRRRHCLRPATHLCVQ